MAQQKAETELEEQKLEYTNEVKRHAAQQEADAELAGETRQRLISQAEIKNAMQIEQLQKDYTTKLEVEKKTSYLFRINLLLYRKL